MPHTKDRLAASEGCWYAASSKMSRKMSWPRLGSIWWCSWSTWTGGRWRTQNNPGVPSHAPSCAHHFQLPQPWRMYDVALKHYSGDVRRLEEARLSDVWCMRPVVRQHLNGHRRDERAQGVPDRCPTFRCLIRYSVGHCQRVTTVM